MASRIEIREGQDRAAKRLFAHADVVSSLLRECLPEGMLPAFDPATLRRFPEEQVDPELSLRRADIAWQFDLAGGLPVVLMIEAQSTPDPAMAARMTVQYGMLCEACLRNGEPVPGVLPVVFYSGRRRWRAAEDLAEEVKGPPGLVAFAARKCYLLLEAGTLPSSQLAERGRMSLILRMAGARRRPEAEEVLRTALLAPGREDREFCRDLTLWAMVLWPKILSGLEIEETGNPEEVLKMMEDRFAEETEELRMEGRLQGIQQGMERGLQQGIEQERALLGRQARRKFGPSTGTMVAEYLSTLNEAADFEHVADWMLDCRSDDEILAKLPGNGK